MSTLSVVIITFNEEQKIAQCLDSVQDIADEIIIVDSHSTDATEAICDRYGVKFFTQDWLGYSDQKNLADELATCDLIFSIDADEALSDELKQSIKALKDKEIAENENRRERSLCHEPPQQLLRSVGERMRALSRD